MQDPKRMKRLSQNSESEPTEDISNHGVNITLTSFHVLNAFVSTLPSLLKHSAHQYFGDKEN